MAYGMFAMFILPIIIPATIAVITGYFAIRRRRWGYTLAGTMI